MISTIIVLCTAVIGALGSEGNYCLMSQGGSPEYQYCLYGCCCGAAGTYEQCCCEGSGEGLFIFTISGCVIGGLLFLSGIITVICCCIRHKGQSGQVLNTQLEGYPGPMVYAPELSPVYQSSSGEIYQPQSLVTSPPPYSETEGDEPYDEAPPEYEKTEK